jgi:hypothetical protein
MSKWRAPSTSEGPYCSSCYTTIFCLSPISHRNVKLPYQHYLYELDMYQQFGVYQLYKALLPICAVDM